MESLLNTSIDVERKSATKDASGGSVPGWHAVAGLSGLPALVQPTTGKAVRTLGQRQVFVSHHVYLAAAADVRRGDRVSHPATGRYFTVHGFEDMGGQGRAWRIECTEET